MATDLREGDYMKRLIEYVTRNLSNGYNLDQIRLVLLQQGYSRAAIDRAIKLAQEKMPKPKPLIIKEKPKVELQEPEKKPGFFARLFGAGKKKKVNDQAKIDPNTGKLL